MYISNHNTLIIINLFTDDEILERQIELIEDSNDSVFIEDRSDIYDSSHEDGDY